MQENSLLSFCTNHHYNTNAVGMALRCSSISVFAILDRDHTLHADGTKDLGPLDQLPAAKLVHAEGQVPRLLYVQSTKSPYDGARFDESLMIFPALSPLVFREHDGPYVEAMENMERVLTFHRPIYLYILLNNLMDDAMLKGVQYHLKLLHCFVAIVFVLSEPHILPVMWSLSTYSRHQLIYPAMRNFLI